jgi:hypothetical protein
MGFLDRRARRRPLTVSGGVVQFEMVVEANSSACKSSSLCISKSGAVRTCFLVAVTARASGVDRDPDERHECEVP